jgi:hypothetical protein
VTSSTPVTYQVYATALGTVPAAGNIYSGPPEIGANEVYQFYVGVGNYITVKQNYRVEPTDKELKQYLQEEIFYKGTVL